MKWNVLVWVLVFLAVMSCSRQKQGVSKKQMEAFDQKVAALNEKLTSFKERKALQAKLATLGLSLDHSVGVLPGEHANAEVYVESLKVAELSLGANQRLEIKTIEGTYYWEPQKTNRQSVQQLRNQLIPLNQSAVLTNSAGLGSFLDELYPESAAQSQRDVATWLTAAVVSLN